MVVTIDKFSTLIEENTFLLGQASLSISYTRRLSILKTLLKDPRKAKTLLKEKAISKKVNLAKNLAKLFLAKKFIHT